MNFMNSIFRLIPFMEGDGGAGGGGTPPAEPPTPPADPPAQPQIDYDKLSDLIAGKQTVAEDKVLRGYFKQQGLSEEQMASAIADYKEKQKANEPDVVALQQNVESAEAAARQAMIERDSYLLADELGLDIKSMPYIMKLADVSAVIGDDGTVDSEKLKEAINKVLEDVPQLKPNKDDVSKGGFHPIGGSGGSGAGDNKPQPAVASKPWNRFNF